MLHDHDNAVLLDDTARAVVQSALDSETTVRVCMGCTYAEICAEHATPGHRDFVNLLNDNAAASSLFERCCRITLSEFALTNLSISIGDADFGNPTLQLARLVPSRAPIRHCRLVVSAWRTAVSSVRFGNPLAETTFRALRHFVDAASGHRPFFVLFCSLEQPLRLGSIANSLRASCADLVNELEALLSRLGFIVTDGVAAVPPLLQNGWFFLVQHDDVRVHRDIAVACDDVLRRNRSTPVRVLCAAPPPAPRELFAAERRQEIFGHKMPDMNDVSMIERWVSKTAPSVDADDPLEALRAFGVDLDSPFNDRLRYVVHVPGASVGARIVQHAIGVMCGHEFVFEVPLLGDDIAQQRSADTIERVRDQDIGVHVRSSDVLIPRFRRGTPRLPQLATFSVDDIIALEEDEVALFHGTTIEAATNIVANGADAEHGSSNADFGRAFYTAEQAAYALQCAYVSSGGGASDMDAALVIFVVKRAALEALNVLHASGDAWQTLVNANHRSSVRALRDDNATRQLHAQFVDADVVIGSVPEMPDAVQRAFRTDESLDALRAPNARIVVVRIRMRSVSECGAIEES